MLEQAYRDTRTCELSDGPICYLRKGRGPALVLLHGIPLSLLTWRHNLDALARHFTVIAFDFKGFGRSVKEPGDHSPEGHARVLGELLDSQGIGAASLVGSSYGCAPAAVFALTEPQRVDRLVLINSVGHPGGRHSLERLVRIGLVAGLLKSTLRSRRLGRRLFTSKLRRSYGVPDRMSPALRDAYLTLLRERSGEETFLTTLKQFDESSLAARMPRIEHETMILWGGRDRVLPLSDGRRLAREIAGSRLEVVPDCGHLPHEEAPQRVNRLIEDFLSRPVAAAGPAA